MTRTHAALAEQPPPPTTPPPDVPQPYDPATTPLYTELEGHAPWLYLTTYDPRHPDDPTPELVVAVVREPDTPPLLDFGNAAPIIHRATACHNACRGIAEPGHLPDFLNAVRELLRHPTSGAALRRVSTQLHHLTTGD